MHDIDYLSSYVELKKKYYINKSIESNNLVSQDSNRREKYWKPDRF